MSPHRQISQLFQALADPTRLEILALLSESEACASDIHTALGMSQPRVARHLKILVATGLLDARRDGRFVRYALGRDPARSRLVRAVLVLMAERSAPGAPEADSAGEAPARSAFPTAHPAGANRALAEAAAAERPADSEESRPPMEDFLL